MSNKNRGIGYEDKESSTGIQKGWWMGGINGRLCMVIQMDCLGAGFYRKMEKRGDHPV